MEYLRKHKIPLIILCAALALILLSSFCASMIQSDAFRVKVTDLEDVSYAAGKVKDRKGTEVSIPAGKVASGILFVPKTATKENPAPAVVLTHGYLNNKELQLQNAIELARRGFVVLTIDRGGHGNNEITAAKSALANTDGMYEAVKYLALQDYVDNARIGISGHSMGGYTTSAVMSSLDTLNLVAAGLIQGYNPTNPSLNKNTGVTSDPYGDRCVGILKAQDDEFFFTSQNQAGEATICREYITSRAAWSFLNNAVYDAEAKPAINLEFRVPYAYTASTEAGATKLTVAAGEKASQPFRIIYESSEIHPQNHFSVESASYVSNFFYTAFGTPAGHDYIKETKETWWIKETFSLLGLIGFFALLVPIVDLLLTLPCFASLRKAEPAEGEVGKVLPELKGVRKHLSYWIVGVLTTLFSGFAMRWVYSGKGTFGWLSKINTLLFTQNTYFAQDTTAAVASWAIVCALFALTVTGIVWLINHIINVVSSKKSGVAVLDEHPMAPARIEGGFGAVVKTFGVAVITVALMYIVVFINWAIWKVDFRIWTVDVKVFEVRVLLPTMLRYMVPFFVFYFINSILNEGYAVSNLPEWATIAINAVFNFLGILLVFLIQYGTFRTTGVLWASDMNLGYIVLFPIVAILIVATINSRLLSKRTGNAWLGAFVNTILFTIMTVANTAASYPYAGFFA